MTDEKAAEIAREGGREGAREILTMLGVDLSVPDAIGQFQRDLIFLRDTRLGAQAIKRKVIMTVLASLLTAALAYAALVFHR